NDVVMTVDGDWAVAKNVTIAKNNEFKFRADKAWTLSYGSACDVVADKTYNTYNNGGNMKFIGETGAYDIYFSLVSAKFYMTVAGAEAPAEPEALATPVVKAEVKDNTITLTWEAVDNAAQYGITVGTEMPVFVEDTTYVFTGEYETEYTFSVVAVPEDETKFAVSEAAVVTPTTEAEPAEEVVYTTVAEFLDAAEDESATAPMYTLKGTITAVANDYYGNFDLTDDTGTVYIYGLCSPDGATQKYWATSGAKLGDDIVIKTVRTSFNGTAQGKNAWFVELVSPGTRAFWTFDKDNVVFGSTEAAQQTINVVAYNIKNDIVVSSSNPHFTAKYNDGVITIDAAENTTYEKIEAVVNVTCGDLTKVITVSQAALVDPEQGITKGEQYTYTFTSTVFNANGTKTLGDLNWTLEGDGGYWGWDSNGKGQQIGSSGKPYTSMTLSTEDYTEGVEKIIINTAGASSTNAKLEVYVGGVKLGQTVNLTSSLANYEFTNNGEILSGKIEFKYTQTSKKALYIKGITIN
ncbi:MAG: hypothetical protein UHS52_03105, partial [Alistipes sp.]|nr:hypothetical protein [Alistipes sp.]